MSKPGDVLYADGHAWKIREAFNGDLVAEPCTHGACKRIEALSELPDFTWLVRGGLIVAGNTVGALGGEHTSQRSIREQVAYAHGREAERADIVAWLLSKEQDADLTYVEEIEIGTHVTGDR